MLEIVFGDDRIGDKNEGRSIEFIDHLLVSPGEDGNQDRELLRSAYIEVDAATSLEVSNIEIIREIDCFVFCFSYGDAEELHSSFRKLDIDPAGYGTCIEITNLEECVKLLWSDGIIRDKGAVKDVLSELICDPVSYRSNRSPLTRGRSTSGNPFIKLEKYSYQKEWRIVAKLKEKLDQDAIFIDCPGIADYLRIVSTTDAEGDSTDARIETEENLISIILNVLEQLDDINRKHSAQTIAELHKPTLDASDIQRISELGRLPDESMNIYKSILRRYWLLREMNASYRSADMDFFLEDERPNGGSVVGLSHRLRSMLRQQ
ncbi:hypothetical protein RUR49_04335 [Pseudoxanthobacter sp. M-2]|uniref:hypothetical protein n=1 Tax=Pseudoxanthobacter sp. M-2 TaxID=3078754 RepID=UPI0038FD2B3D